MPKIPKTLKRKASYSLSVKTLDEIERLSELRQLSRSIIVQLAIENYAKHEDNQLEKGSEIIQNE